MNYEKRTRRIRWTFALMIVFPIFVSSGWSQTGGPFTEIIPQIAIGSFDGGSTKYSTVIEIINTNAISVNISGNFFKEDGSTASVTLATNLTATPRITNGTFSGILLDPNKVLVISGGTTPATTPSTGVIAWGSIVTDSPVSITTFFELRASATNALQSRIGVQASPGNMAKFVIPRVRNVATGLDVGFALVNTAPSLASLTVTLKDDAGATIAMRSLTMAGSSHQSLFTQQFFSLTNEPSGTNFQYIVFDAGTAGQFAAIALAFEGAIQTSFPVEILR
jgi:hypothetical protein